MFIWKYNTIKYKKLVSSFLLMAKTLIFPIYIWFKTKLLHRGTLPPIYLNWIFSQFETNFFPSFWPRVKYFDGPCLIVYILTFYNLKSYTLPVFSLVDSLQPLLWIKEMETWENIIFVHFDMTFLATLTPSYHWELEL